MERVVVKAEYEGEMRRIALEVGNFDSLEKVASKLFSLKQGSFSLKYIDDEGDVITLCSEEEFLEALRCAKNNILRLTVHRKFPGQDNLPEESKEEKPEEKEEEYKQWEEEEVEGEKREEKMEEDGHKLEEKKEQASSHEHKKQGKKDGEVGDLFERVRPMLQQVAGGILGVGCMDFVEDFLMNELCELEERVCDSCDSFIFGKRFHCSDCVDFDYCSDCYGSKGGEHLEGHHIVEVNPLKDLKEMIKEKIDSIFFSGKSKQVAQEGRKEGIVEKEEETQEEEEEGKEELFSRNEGRKEIVEEEFASQEADEQEVLEDEVVFYGLPENSEYMEIEGDEEEQEEQREDPEEGEALIQDLEEEPEPIEAKIMYLFEDKLEALHSMGFLDRDKNMRVLIQTRGELIPAIQTLLRDH